MHTDYTVSLGFITKITVADPPISKVLRHFLYSEETKDGMGVRARPCECPAVYSVRMLMYSFLTAILTTFAALPTLRLCVE